MEPTDKTPEERIGTSQRIRERAKALDDLAEACGLEAAQQEVAAHRLRTRVGVLREKAEEYRLAARTAEMAETLGVEEVGSVSDPGAPAPDVVLLAPDDPDPERARTGDVVMRQDPDVESVYHRMEFREGIGWRTMSAAQVRKP